MNYENKWDSLVYPEQDTWCWVSNGKSVWIAKRDLSSVGGWTNEDTWEDFNMDVIEWIPLDKPTKRSLV